MAEKKVAKPPVSTTKSATAKAVAKAPVEKDPPRKSAARKGVDGKVARATPVEAKKPSAFTLAEVRSFISQHNEGRGIKLPGRTPDDIGTIHDAYNQSTYKYPERILALLDKWAQATI